MRVLLLTGPGGDAQGWGDLNVTKTVSAAAEASGHAAPIAYVETDGEFRATLDRGGFDIVWSALYYITDNEAYVGRGEGGLWVADELDARGIPYIGSNSQTMKDMIDKFQTHRTLASRGVPVPAHYLVKVGDDVSRIRYPAFVKPMGESRSVGINHDSVVENETQLWRQVEWIQREYQQASLVEDFMPGDEFTVLVLGNGATRQCLPGQVVVEAHHYGRHKVLRSDLRGVGLTHIVPAGPRGDEAATVAGLASDAMGCLDHVRIDIKAAADESLRIMEVNGIPGLKPGKSWTPQLYDMYYPSSGDALAGYRRLIAAIIESGCQRAGLLPASA